MDRRYQVFVSSTFEDLRDERAEVISALLQVDCIPAGMELFPAADDNSWTLIKSVIDDCDYFLVLVAGRYGSIDSESGKSYTQLEYEHALKIGKPIIALIHSDPGSLPAARSEVSEVPRHLLEEFRLELQKKNCRKWKDKGELMLAVFTGVQHLKKSRPAGGWVRGSQSLEEANDELLRLRRLVEELTNDLASTKKRVAPQDTELLAQGTDLTEIEGTDVNGKSYRGKASWNEVFRSVLPHTIGGGAIPSTIGGSVIDAVFGPVPFGEGPWMTMPSLGKVLNQMIALGFIEAKVDTDGGTRWISTPYGLQTGAKLIAIKRGEEGHLDF